MALRQPATTTTNRPSTAPAVDPQPTSAFAVPLRQDVLDDSREWILFPTTHTRSLSTEHTPTLSRLSDLGSLNDSTRSGQEAHAAKETTDQSSYGHEEDGDQELDSLDEGLSAFHAQEPSRLLSDYFHPSSSVLPRHNGYGAFPTSTPRAGHDGSFAVPHSDTAARKHSLSLCSRPSAAPKYSTEEYEKVDRSDGVFIDEERRQRIETWRLDHSARLLDEIEKAARRQGSTAKESSRSARNSRNEKISKELRNILSSGSFEGLDESHHELNPSLTDRNGLPKNDEESRWGKLLRYVMHDLVGIDDGILSVIFGESLISNEDDNSADDLPPAKAPRLHSSQHAARSNTEMTWEGKLSNRIQRELGYLLSESQRPDTSGTGFLPHPSTLDYAGIPVTRPTSSKTHPRPPRLRANKTSLRPTQLPTAEITSLPSFTFHPTIQEEREATISSETETSSYAALWGIEEEENKNIKFDGDRNFWEETPDLKSIFQRFMFTHFVEDSGSRSTRRDDSNPPLSGTQLRYPQNNPTNLVATQTTPDSLRRAALIREHHPLTTNRQHRHTHHPHLHQQALSHTRRQSSQLRSLNFAGSRSITSSCANESLKRMRSGIFKADSSITATSLSTSRNYWDIGGVGGGGDGGGGAESTGSDAAAGGWGGVWGEV